MKPSTPHHTDARLDRHALAKIIARDISDSSFVNLGIWQPILVSNYLSPTSGVVLHTENGMLGMGPEAHGNRSTSTWSTPEKSRSPKHPVPPTSTTPTPSP